MKRAVFAIALTTAVAFGARAQNENIGGDLNWPTTPIVDDAPVQQQPRPKPAQTGPQQEIMLPAGLQQPPAAESAGATPATANGKRARGNSFAQEQARREWNGEARLPRRAIAREAASRAEEEMPELRPPVPGRREANAPVAPPLVPAPPQEVPVPSQNGMRPTEDAPAQPLDVAAPQDAPVQRDAPTPPQVLAVPAEEAPVQPLDAVAPQDAPIPPVPSLDAVGPQDARVPPLDEAAPQAAPVPPVEVAAPQEAPVRPLDAVAPQDAPVPLADVTLAPEAPVAPLAVAAPKDSPVQPLDVAAPQDLPVSQDLAAPQDMALPSQDAATPAAADVTPPRQDEPHSTPAVAAPTQAAPGLLADPTPEPNASQEEAGSPPLAVPAPRPEEVSTQAATASIEEAPVAPAALDLAQTPPGAKQDEDLARMIGQMLIVGFQGTRPDQTWPRQVAAQIESGKIGGVLVMTHNIQAPRQLAALTGAFRHAKAQFAPFIAIDHEGGPAPQLPPDKGFQLYASAAELGMSNDPLNAYNIYQGMAVELAANGFNVNLGPAVDLDQIGENGSAVVNNDRYGSQPKHVAAFAKAFRLAHHSEGLLTVLKHFPGPIRARTEANGAAGLEPRWDPVSLEPYRQLVEGGNADMVMVGHSAHPDFSDAPGLPASLSEKAIQTRLRSEIGFAGVVISDDLEGEAVAARFPLEESVVRALKAGNDMLLIGNRTQLSPDLPERVAAIIKQAVATGALTRERLQASYDRIVAAKQGLAQSAREIASAKRSEAGDAKPGAP